MQFRNRQNGDVGWTAWEPYATNRLWTLESGLGQKWVQTRFRDCAGNDSTIAEDSIIVLDTIKVYLPLVLR